MYNIDCCNICGGSVKNKLELAFKDVVGMAEEYTQCVAMCPKCGFIFTRNPFSSEQLENRYKHYSKFEFDSEDYILEESNDYKIRSMRQKQFIQRNIDMNEVRSIIEIGAASGYNLSLYEDRKVYGVEPSRINCDSAKQRYGIDMFCGMFDEFLRLKSEVAYDMVFLSHVLEHIVNPFDFINECKRINTRYMFIEVPTFDYKFVDEPFGMFAEEHVNMFTLESLSKMMNQCSYELVNVEMIFGLEQKLPAGWPAISTIWRKSEKPTIHHTIMKSENVLDAYIDASKVEMKRVCDIINSIKVDEKLAIWGTGHHASMLLANTKLCEKNIVKVYDSDNRKQGVSFAGVSITPFSCEDITSGQVETILLATYTAQIALEKILLPYRNDVRIVKLYEL